MIRVRQQQQRQHLGALPALADGLPATQDAAAAAVQDAAAAAGGFGDGAATLLESSPDQLVISALFTLSVIALVILTGGVSASFFLEFV